MSDLPSVTTGQLRALRIAARHRVRQPPAERIENDPHGKQYIQELADLGLLWRGTSERTGREGWEVTVLAVLLLEAHHAGQAVTRPIG